MSATLIVIRLITMDSFNFYLQLTSSDAEILGPSLKPHPLLGSSAIDPRDVTEVRDLLRIALTGSRRTEEQTRDQSCSNFFYGSETNYQPIDSPFPQAKNPSGSAETVQTHELPWPWEN